MIKAKLYTVENDVSYLEYESMNKGKVVVPLYEPISEPQYRQEKLLSDIVDTINAYNEDQPHAKNTQITLVRTRDNRAFGIAVENIDYRGNNNENSN